MDIQPAVAALSRETALVEEERRRLEEERKGLEAERADYYKKLERYEEIKLLFEKERDLLTEMKEAQKKNAEADTRLRQLIRTKNKYDHLFESTRKLREDFGNIPCVFCKVTTKTPEDDYRVCTPCMKEHPNSASLIAATQSAEADPLFCR